jgi:hypothetical protein
VVAIVYLATTAMPVAAETDGCAVISPWVHALRLRMDLLKVEYPREIAVVCRSVDVSNTTGRDTELIGQRAGVLGVCPDVADEAADCPDVVSEVMDLVGRVAALHRFASENRCAMPTLPSPC